MKKNIKRMIIASVATLTLSVSAGASTFDTNALNSHVQTATDCIIGQVVSINHEMRHGFAVTLATVSVSKAAFGNASEEITVVVPGGPVANANVPVAQVFAGAPTLRAGKNMMLVLNEISSGEYVISGLSAGAINVVSGSNGPQIALGGGGFISVTDAIESVRELRANSTSISTAN